MVVTDTSRFNISVTGLAAPIDFNYGLESVTISITHNQDKDIDCFLAAPDGTLIELTTDNGNTGHNFTSTVFRHDASTSITSGSAPFTGNYKPEGNLWRVNNNQSGNGTWQLRVIDDSNNGISGSLVSWSLKFSNTPAQTFIFSQSSLPIVVINTNGQTIADNPKIIADFQIIDNGDGIRNHLTDAKAYTGKIGIEIRGSSSQMFPKKSFGFETMDNSGTIKVDTSLLGMPSEHDWILSANYTDKTFCRNVLTYQLSREMGHYAANTKYVDVVLNGQYWGVYVFMESLKRDKNRIDIAKLNRTETTAPDVTGGYIVKIDKSTGSGGSGWTSNYAPINHPNGQTIYIQYDYPSSDSIVPAQQAYIKAYVDSFENALAGPNFRDSVLGYSKFIGNGSWIDYFFNNELSKNTDGYRISAYLHKDNDKTLKAGPVWDYDIAYGNANYCSGSDTTGWAYLFNCTGDSWQVPFWWQKLLQDTNYTNQMKCRWTEYRNSTLSLAHINAVIDSITTLLNESQGWNFTQWPILGTYVWPNPSPQPSTYAGEIQNLKNWMSRRLAWMDANMPGRCSCSVNVVQQNVSCNNQCDGQLVVLGTSPYSKTYLWDNGSTEDTLQGMCAGTQTVQLTDAIGCKRSATVTITQPAVLTASASAINAPCNAGGCAGQASVVASGGTAPYQYAWSDGQTTSTATNLCSGNYTVTITDAHGCTKTSSVSIVNPSSPVITVTNTTNSPCFNQAAGSAAINVTGGSAPYSYSWSPAGGTTSQATNLVAGTYTVTVTDATGCPSSRSVTITQPPAILLSTTSQDALCYGQASGSASVIANGGSGVLHYQWMPNGESTTAISNLLAGTYSVMVTDGNGCTQSETVIVSQAPVINATLTSTPIHCHGGNDGVIAVAASGGTGTLSYAWNPGSGNTSMLTGLSAGTYQLTITDSVGCSIQTSRTLTDPSALQISHTSTSSICSSATGSVSVSVNGGTGGYNYLWSPGGQTTATVNSVTAGNYSVVVTDANICTISDQVIVNSSSGMTVNVASQNDVSCNGGANGAVKLNVSGATAPISYSWTPNVSSLDSAQNLSAGTYSITVNDAMGCTTIQQVTIIEPQVLSATLSYTDVICNGGNTGGAMASVSGGTAPFSYQWSNGAGTDSVAGNLSAGNYSVLITDQNNCTYTSSIVISEPAILQISSSTQTATCDQANGSATVVVSGGTGSYQYQWTPAISLDDHAVNILSGNYDVQATDANGCTISTQFTVANTSRPLISVTSFSEASCNGSDDGSITLAVNGGTGNVTYAWLPDVSNGNIATQIPGGVYSIVTEDALGCRDSIGYILNEPAPLGALMLPHDVTCFGGNDGKIFTDVGGGTAPYTYLWTPTAQITDSAVNLTPGTYTVQLTDAHGCTAIASATIGEPAAMSITTNAGNYTCYKDCNGFAEVTVSGGSGPYSYAWSNGATTSSINNGCVGINSVVITDAMACTESRQFSFVQSDSISISIMHADAGCDTCHDGNAMASVSGGVPPYNFQWSPNVSNTASASALMPGTYYVCITDSNECTKCDSVVIRDLTAGIHEVKTSSFLYVYPNPAGDYAVFAFTTNRTQEISISILNVTGKLVKKVYEGEMDEGEHLLRVETNDLAPGVYFFNYRNAQLSKTGTLVISRGD